MALPSNVGFCTVGGRFIRALVDGTDSDRYPDGVPIAGLTVTFRASITSARNASATPPVFVFLDPIVATTNSDGVLIGPDDIEKIMLVASNDPDLDPTGWTYTATIAASSIAPVTFSFIAPVDGVIDLTTLVPVSASPGTELAAWTAAVAATAANVVAAQAASSVPRTFVYNDTASAWARMTAVLLRARQAEQVRVHTMGNSLFAGPDSTAGYKDFQAWLRANLLGIAATRGGDFPSGTHWWLTAIAGTPSPLNTAGGVAAPTSASAVYQFDTTGQKVSFRSYPCSGIRLWFAAGGGTGTVTVTIDSETPVTGVGATSGGVKSVDVLSTKGFSPHTVTIDRGAGTAFVLAVEPIVPTMSISDAGIPGTSAADWLATGGGYSGSAFNGAAGFNPDASIILLQTNEWNGQITTSDYQTQLDTLVSQQLACKSDTAAVILCVPPKPSGVPAAGAEVAGKTWADYTAATKAVGAARNVPVLDFTALFGGAYKTAYMADALHWNATGQIIAGRAAGRAMIASDNAFLP